MKHYILNCLIALITIQNKLREEEDKKEYQKEQEIALQNLDDRAFFATVPMVTGGLIVLGNRVREEDINNFIWQIQRHCKDIILKGIME